jgi:CYTH domain-containing protein
MIHPLLSITCLGTRNTITSEKLLIQDKLVLTNDRNRKKILIKTIPSKQRFYQNHIAQGYLSSLAERTVRVRIKANKGYLTIKGMRRTKPACHVLRKKEIPVDEAKSLLLLKGTIDKPL